MTNRRRIWTRLSLLWCAVLSMSPVYGMNKNPLQTVPHVDLQRYAGKWYEIARLPNRFQKKCVADVTAEYTLTSQGAVSVINRCSKADGGVTLASGVARIVDPTTNAKLEVRFAPAWLAWLPWVWGDYWIIGLAPDYSYAVVGAPGRDYLWILSRTPMLSDRDFDEARRIARQQGFDVFPLIRTTQH